MMLVNRRLASLVVVVVVCLLLDSASSTSGKRKDRKHKPRRRDAPDVKKFPNPLVLEALKSLLANATVFVPASLGNTANEQPIYVWNDRSSSEPESTSPTPFSSHSSSPPSSFSFSSSFFFSSSPPSSRLPSSSSSSSFSSTPPPPLSSSFVASNFSSDATIDQNATLDVTNDTLLLSVRRRGRARIECLRDGGSGTNRTVVAVVVRLENVTFYFSSGAITVEQQGERNYTVLLGDDGNDLVKGGDGMRLTKDSVIVSSSGAAGHPRVEVTNSSVVVELPDGVSLNFTADSIDVKHGDGVSLSLSPDSLDLFLDADNATLSVYAEGVDLSLDEQETTLSFGANFSCVVWVERRTASFDFDTDDVEVSVEGRNVTIGIWADRFDVGGETVVSEGVATVESGLRVRLCAAPACNRTRAETKRIMREDDDKVVVYLSGQGLMLIAFDDQVVAAHNPAIFDYGDHQEVLASLTW